MRLWTRQATSGSSLTNADHELFPLLENDKAFLKARLIGYQFFLNRHHLDFNARFSEPQCFRFFYQSHQRGNSLRNHRWPDVSGAFQGALLRISLTTILQKQAVTLTIQSRPAELSLVQESISHSCENI